MDNLRRGRSVIRNSKRLPDTFTPLTTANLTPKDCIWMQSKSEGSAKKLRASGDLGLAKEEDNL
jgi:hypothetical protein